MEKGKELTTISDKLAEYAQIGMRGVDPLDIKPPKIILMQKSSNLSDFVDSDGNNPKVGQFFHTGKLQILDTFECYFLVATKGEWVNRRAGKTESEPQYIAVGVTADELRPFGMNFRSSSLYALSSLFTAAASNKRPMFSIKCKVETKDLSNEKGAWTVPVVRVVELEADPKILNQLKAYAIGFDAKSEAIAREEEEDASFKEKVELFDEPKLDTDQGPTGKSTEPDVDSDEIPF